jgi:hypothetical protein
MNIAGRPSSGRVVACRPHRRRRRSRDRAGPRAADRERRRLRRRGQEWPPRGAQERPIAPRRRLPSGGTKVAGVHNPEELAGGGAGRRPAPGCAAGGRPAAGCPPSRDSSLRPRATAARCCGAGRSEVAGTVRPDSSPRDHGRRPRPTALEGLKTCGRVRRVTGGRLRANSPEPTRRWGGVVGVAGSCAPFLTERSQIAQSAQNLPGPALYL